jgi:integrase/recombinase XerD
MQTTRIIHREKPRIKVDFPYNQYFSSEIKKIKEAAWSRTQRAWLINDDESSWNQLKVIFPETLFEKSNDIAIKTISKDDIQINTLPKVESKEIKKPPLKKWIDFSKIYVEVIGRKILIKLPKNEIDTKFLVSIKYSNWEKEQFLWSLPNYPGNLELIQQYFGERIFDLKIHDQIETNLLETNLPKINKNEVLVYKTNSKRLKLIFGYVPELTKLIKTIPFHSWDAKNKWWSIPYSEQFLEEIKNGIAALNLHFKYEEQVDVLNRVARISAYDIPNYRYCPEEFSLKLIEMRYSPKTIKLYAALFEEFINHYPTYDIKNIDETLIIKFLRFLVIERKVSITYQNQSINAIKFYYEKVLGGQRKFYFIDRPAKEKTLPTVLSTEEVTLILKQTQNIKHKAILMLIYSAGLRISEAINLKIKDIDSNRMQIRIEQAKGKRDRYTLLSEKTLLILRQYYSDYKPRNWLFEGQIHGQQYSARSIQNIFSNAAAKAGVLKDVSVHTLRHSFATHLLENGTDIRYIQSLLGHANTKTTEIYTHITTKGFDQIKSPLDNLDL